MPSFTAFSPIRIVPTSCAMVWVSIIRAFRRSFDIFECWTIKSCTRSWVFVKYS